MGHGNIADEFDVLNDSVREYVRENYGKISHEELKTGIVEMLPQKYLKPKS